MSGEMAGRPTAAAAAAEARRVLRAARVGSLATVGEGQPFASLVTPATAPDGSVLLLLSGLSDHTRHLRADGRCSVMVTGAATGANPQTAPRLSLVGRAEPEADGALKARWVALHPYAAFYADLPDFTLWRMRVEAGQYVGGFARAFRFGAGALMPGQAAVEAVAGAEARIIGHMNADHADAVAAIARARGLEGAGWRMVACDVDGFDVAAEGAGAGDGGAVRIAWEAPVDGAAGVRAALVAFAGAARLMER